MKRFNESSEPMVLAVSHLPINSKRRVGSRIVSGLIGMEGIYVAGSYNDDEDFYGFREDELQDVLYDNDLEEAYDDLIATGAARVGNIGILLLSMDEGFDMLDGQSASAFTAEVDAAVGGRGGSRMHEHHIRWSQGGRMNESRRRRMRESAVASKYPILGEIFGADN